MRGPLSWKPLREELLLLAPVPGDGLCRATIPIANRSDLFNTHA
jgi:hypothetical protein